MMKYAGDYVVPTWLACVYLGSNVVLNTLNFYWFGKMIETIKKRFTESGGEKKGEKEEGVMVEGLIDSSTLITEIVEEDGVVEADTGSVKIEKGKGVSSIEVENKQVRRKHD